MQYHSHFLPGHTLFRCLQDPLELLRRTQYIAVIQLISG